MSKRNEWKFWQDDRERRGREGHIGTFGAAGIVVVVIIVILNNYFNGNTSSTEAIPDGKALEQHTEQQIHTDSYTAFVDRETVHNGTGLKVNTATVSKDEAGKQSLKVNISVNGIGQSGYNMATFAEGQLVNADNKSTIQTNLNGFTEPGMRSVDETFSLDEAYDIAQGQNYLLQMKDLYLIQRSEASLPESVQAGHSYTVQAPQPTPIQIEQMVWSNNKEKLTVVYRIDREQSIAGVSPGTLNLKDDMNGLIAHAKQGDQTIELISLNRESKDNVITQQFAVPASFNDQQREHIGLSLEYGKVVRQIKGTWTVSFELDEDQP